MKSIIVITTPNGKDQYYRDKENSVMHVGKMLESFVISAGFMGNIAEDNHLAYLLGMEKNSTPERVGTLHGGIDYIWYVEINENGFTISYTDTEGKGDFDFVSKHLQNVEGKTIYIK